MPPPIDWEKEYSAGTYQGSQDVKHPARYQLLSGLLRKTESVLDVGCGIGLLRGFTDCDYTGIDLSSVAIEQARQRWATGTFLCTDAERWQSTERFGAVVLNEFLYYTADPAAVLRQYASFVKPGGLLIVSIFDKSAPFWRRSPNHNALRVTKAFARQTLQAEYQVMQDSRKWTVLVIEPHCQ